jgi:hypothetical protein
MKPVDLSAALLRARLLAMRAPMACAAVVLCLLGAAGWSWVLPQRAADLRLASRPAPLPPVAGTLAAVVVAPPPDSQQNLAQFYAALGQRHYAEQEVKMLFALAAKNGLTLTSGEYKESVDAASRVTSYQVVLPVKGPYNAIWQFCLQVLAALPFAALDDISFKRELIAEAAPEARLSFTFYLKDGEVAR